MPKPSLKSEEELREWEILDAARADIDLVVKSYRRRMQNVQAELIADFRRQVADGEMPAIDAAYRDAIRARVQGYARELGDGS